MAVSAALCGAWGEKLQSHGPGSGARHVGRELSVRDQAIASGSHIAATGLAKVIQRRAQRRNQRNRRA